MDSSEPVRPESEWWSHVRDCARRALQCGALQPIDTRTEFADDGDVTFVIRIPKSAGRKRVAGKPARGSPARNPFLPYQRELFVADISPTHVCLLNKFSVVENHVLIVTRAFEDQTSPLTLDDFAALWRCLEPRTSLGFYNGGRQAGASQPHKHLQVVPLPLTSRGPAIPIEPLLPVGEWHVSKSEPTSQARLPFRHAFARLSSGGLSSGGGAVQDGAVQDGADDSRKAFAVYRHMLEQLGVRRNDAGRLSPYNVLVTRDWMLVVPRSHDAYESISINALGFAGSLFVRDEQQSECVRKIGPLQLLRHVAG